MKRLALIALLLVGCSPNTTDPILSTRQCLRSHMETVFVHVPLTTCSGTPMRCITVMQLQTQFHKVCDQSIDIQYPNPDYGK